MAIASPIPTILKRSDAFSNRSWSLSKLDGLFSWINVHRYYARIKCDEAFGPSSKTEGKPKLLVEEIRGFIALFPFNVTAETWLLGWIDGLICQDGLDGCPQVFSCHRNLIAWPTLVELSSIDQFALAIK